MTLSLSRIFRCYLLTLILCGALRSFGQESYFVTYSHQMEEPGNLEVGLKSVAGSPSGGNGFVGSALEFEYGCP